MRFFVIVSKLLVKKPKLYKRFVKIIVTITIEFGKTLHMLHNTPIFKMTCRRKVRVMVRVSEQFPNATIKCTNSDFIHKITIAV